MTSPAPLPMMPTRAVEADVVEALLAGEPLAVVELLGRGVLLPLGMAERGVLVERHLGVERVHLAIGRQDQRVDLDEIGVAVDVRVKQLHQDVDRAVGGRRDSAPRTRPTPRHSVFGQPATGSMCNRAIASGVGCCNLFDLDATLRGQHAEVLLRRRDRG